MESSEFILSPLISTSISHSSPHPSYTTLVHLLPSVPTSLPSLFQSDLGEKKVGVQYTDDRRTLWVNLDGANKQDKLWELSVKVVGELREMKVEEVAVVVDGGLEVERVEWFWQGVILENYRFDMKTSNNYHIIKKLDLVFEKDLTEKELDRVG
jgi:hypothetical protein